jgi:ribokinase
MGHASKHRPRRFAVQVTRSAATAGSPGSVRSAPMLVQARVAVVGHCEWVDFAVVPRLPHPGEIQHVPEFWAEAAGGGAVAAVQMTKLTGGSLFLTALAGDDLGRRTEAQLAGHGVTVHAAPREGIQRRAFTYLTDDGERTITVLGDRLVPHRGDPLPWHVLDDVGGVYVTGGDADALHECRRAGTIVATPRADRALRESGVAVDVLVHSGKDPGEELDPAELDPPPRTVVTTLGGEGGRWDGAAGSGTWRAQPLPGPRIDQYGAGDSFAAGLTTGLAAGMPIAEAVELGARCGAANMTGRGPYAGQLDLR